MKTKQTFKKRLVSGFLALVMVLGFLPANLFPAAEAAAALPPNGAAGVTVGDISLSISSNGDYTVTLKSTTANSNASVTFAVLPAFTSKSVAIQDAMGTVRLPYANLKAGNLLNNIGAYYDNGANGSATLPVDVSHNQVSAALTNGGTTTWTGSLGSNAMSTLNSFAASHPNPNGIKPADGVFTYILLFVTGASDVQWTYATISAEGEPNLTSSNDIVIHHAGGSIVGGYSPTTTITNNGSGNAYISTIEWSPALRAALSDHPETGIAETNVINKGTGGAKTLGITDGLIDGTTPTVSGYVTITYTTATDSGTASSTAPVKTLTINVTIIDDRFNITVPSELVFTGSYDGTSITWTSKPDLTLTPHHNPDVAWYSEDDGYWLRWDNIVLGPCSVSDGNQYGWNISSLTGQLVDRTAPSDYTLVEPASLTPGAITSVTDYVAYLTIPYSFAQWANYTYETADDKPDEDDADWEFDNKGGTGTIMVKLIARITPEAAPATYTVSFDLNGAPGTAPAKQSIVAGQTVTDPGNPTWDANHTFAGWYTADGSGPWTFGAGGDTVNSNMTLYAHWTQKYAVTFDENKPSTAAPTNNVSGMPSDSTGSTPSVDDDNPQYVISGRQPDLPQQPTLNGYSFLGWDTDKDSTSPRWTNATNAPTITRDVTYHAIWKVEPVTFAAVVFGGKQGKTPVIDTTSGGLGYATAGGHNKTDFEYTFAATNDAAGWAASGNNYTFTPPEATTSVVFSYDTSGNLIATGTLERAVGGSFFVKAKSKLNGQETIAKVTIQVPPRVNSGSMQENSLLPGKTVHTAELGLTDGTKIPSDVTWSPGIDAAQWYWGFGGTMVGITNTSEQGPTVAVEITGETNVQQVTIPTDAVTGSHLWLKVTGDGTNVDAGATQTKGGGEAIWVDMGEIGKDRRSIVVVPSVWTTGGTKVTTPADIKANAVPGQLGAGESGQLNTISTSTEYVFVGWSLNDSNTGYTTPGGSLTGPGSNWTVATESPYLASGRNSATFNMKTLPASEDPIRIYAIYKQVETRTITVVMQPGVASVQYAIGSTTKTETNTGTTEKTFTIKPKTTDSVTFIASAGANSICSGYTFNPNSPGVAFSIITGDNKSTVSLTAKQDFTITFNATSVADLHVDGTSHYASKVEGYSTLASSPIFTATLTNPGALRATIDTANSGLYADNSGAIGSKVGSSYDTFSVTTVPTTVDANTASNSTKYQVKVTPKDGLTAGTYTVWLKITENTGKDNTKRGENLVYTQKITFVVTANDKFDGRVTLNLDDNPLSGQTVTLKPGTGSTVGTTPSGNVYTAPGLSVGQTYNILVNGTDSGYVLHAAAKDQTINLYTLATNVTPAVTDGSNPVRVTVSQSSGKAITVGGKPAYTEGSSINLSVPRNASRSGQAYVFDQWTGADGTPVTAVSTTAVMDSAKTVTAKYVASVSLIYHNNYGSAGVFHTDSGHKSGEEVTVTSLTPTRTGYDFKGWATTAGATTADVGTKVTMGNNDMTLYAVWGKAEATWSTLPSGEYGRDYTGNAVVTGGNLGAVTYSVSAPSASASGTQILDLSTIGLSYATATGVITGKPTKAGTFSFKVTARNAASGETWSKDYVLTVAKATPTITGVRFTAAGTGGITEGMNISDLRIDATVTAPYWNGTAWEASMPFTYTTYVPNASGTRPGTIAITKIDSAAPGATLSFGSKTNLPAEITLTPSGNTDVSGQTFDSIYNSTIGNGYINQGTQIYSFKATTPITFADVTSDATAVMIDGIAAKDVTIINTSITHTDGYFSYTLENEDGTAYTLGEFTVNGSSAATGASLGRLTTIVGGETATLTVKPVGANLHEEIGTHTMFIHIVEKDAAAGNTVAETRVPVTLKIIPGTFTGTVEALLHDVGSTSGTAGQISGAAVKLRELGTTNETTANYNGTTKKYEAAGLTAGTTYSVWINGIQVSGKYVTYTTPGTSADLYQVVLTATPSGSPAPTLTGKGYYLENQGVALNADPTETVAGRTYNFEKWTTDDLATKEFLGAAAGFAMPAKPVTMTANYKEPDALTYSVAYHPGAGVTGVTVPVDTSKYPEGATVRVSPMTPVRTGYTFQNWSITPAPSTGGSTVGVNGSFTMPGGPVTLTAQWEKVAAPTLIENLPDGTYGSEYYGSVAISDTSTTGAVTYSATGLPGGLKIAANGVITGKPYVVGDNQPVRVTATSTADSTLSWTYDVDITVQKATPVLSVASATNAVAGQPYNTATYVVNVAVPKLTTKGADPSGDVWGTETYQYTLPTAGSGDAAATTGALSVTSTGNFANGPNTVKLHWAPGSGNDADRNSNVYSNIYEPGDINAVLGVNATYGITASPIANTWTVEQGYTVSAGSDTGDTWGTVDTSGSVDDAKSLKVTITNKGNQPVGSLSLNLGASQFEITNSTGTVIGSTNGEIAAGGSTDIYVRPKTGAAPSVYTDTLTITGTNVSAEVRLTLVVNRASTFDFEVDTKLHDTGSNGLAGTLGDVDFIALYEAGTTTAATGMTHAGTGKYTWSGLDSSKSYSVVVNGYVTTHVVTATTKDGAGAAKMVVDLYQAVLEQKPDGTGAELKLDSVAGRTSYYYVEGQPFGVSTTVPMGKKLDKWTETQYTTAAGTTTDRSTSASISQVMKNNPVTLTARFSDVVEYKIRLGHVDSTTDHSTVTYSAGQSYLDILTGGTTSGGIYKVQANGTFGLPQPVTGTVGVGQYSITHVHTTGSYTFRGWTTDVTRVTDASAGTFIFTANPAAAAGDGTADRIITLYPVWTRDSELALPAGVIKGVYKHALSEQVKTASGGQLPYGYTTDGLPFGLGLSGTTISGPPNDVGAETAAITVHDNRGDTAKADYSFVIDKADMKLKDADKTTLTTGVSVTVGDDINTAIDDALTFKPDGDGTGETAINGAWTVGDLSGLTKPGVYYVPVTYTPANGTSDHGKDGEHYNVYTDTIKVTVNAKLITAANIGVTVPAAGNTPDDKNSVVKTSLDPTTATFATDVDVAEVFWSPAPSGNFVAGTAYTVTVVLKIKTGSDYRFDVANFAGQINGLAATKISTTEDTATFSYTFPAEDAKINSVNVLVDTLGTGNSNPSVNSAEAYKYKVTDKKWVATSDTVGTTPITNFTTGTNYDLIVTFTAEDGYVFNDGTDYFGGGTDLQIGGKWIAMVNSKDSGADAKTAKVTTALSTDKKTITIRFSSFAPQEKTIQGVTASGDLGIYYVNMGANMHHDAAATGHKGGVGFVFSPAGLTVNAVYRQADGQMTAPEALGSAAYELWVGTPEAAGSVIIWDGTTGRTFEKNSTDDDRDLDGKRVYLKTKEGNLTTQVGQLTVKELTVMSIAAEKDKTLPKPTLEYTVGDSFVPGTMQSTEGVTVTFNTNTSALTNPVNLTGYGAKDLTTNTPTTYFFALDAAGTNELTARALTAADNGKTVYLCYADVNDHVVSTPVGTLRIKSAGMTVTVTDENENDPEYGDKLTAEPNGGTGPHTYQWEVKGPTGTWTPISGETGTTYTPDKDKVGKTIRVVVTDSTGATANEEKAILARSLNFVVSKQDKTEDGDKLNKHSYTVNDFTLTVVGSYGGIRPEDQGKDDSGENKVKLKLKDALNVLGTESGTATAQRPMYGGAAPDSTISWPAITVGDDVATNKTGGYELGGTNATNAAGVAVYRLAAQAQQDDKGTILAKGKTSVTHVDVSFKEVPTFDHDIPGAPMAVTDDRETLPGEGTAFEAKWYTNFNTTTLTGTAATGKFDADTYTVVVKVKPNAAGNYIYDSNTKFNFHFGESSHVEVTPAVNGEVRTMYYTFTVARPKIAYVNVSVDQPVVEVAPKTTVTENQVLGTDSSDRKNDLTPGAVTWTPSATQFAGDTAYTAKFDLTAENGFEFDDNVKFVVNGVGPFAAGDTGASSNIITKVTAKKDGTDDKIYHVEVVFAQLKGGKVNLTDVYVNAVVPAEDKAPDAGYKPSVDTVKPYALTGTNDVWQYWNGSAWTTITDANKNTALGTDGHFLAGMPYRVTGTVKLTDTTHYQITDDTKFYLAGIECTTDMVDSVVNGQSQYAPLTKNGDSTYTLTRQFYIPVDRVIIEVATRATAPAVGGKPADDTYKKSGKVTLAINGKGNVLTSRVTVGDVTWTEAGGASVTTFDKGKSYKATYPLTINETGYTYAASVKFTIHDIEVNTGDPPKTDPVSGITVQAVRNSDTQCTVTVTYPATQSDITVVDVTANYKVPVEGENPAVALNYTPSNQVTLDQAALKTDNSNGSTWHTGTRTGAVVTETGTFNNGDYVVATTFTAKDGFIFSDGTKFIINGSVYTKAANGADVAISADNKTATVYHLFPGQDKTIVRVAANVQQPVAGETRSTDVSKILAQNKDNDDMLNHITVKDMGWTVSNTFGSGYGTASGTTFEANRYYRATFTVEANSGYSFLSGDATDGDVDFLVNGIFKTGTTWIDGADTATASGIKVTTTGNGNSYTVTVDFPVTGSVANVLTVWGNGNAVAGEPITKPTVPGSEPYEAISAQTKWQHKETDGSWTDVNSGNFKPGHTYKAVIRTQIKAVNAGQYQFTTSTAGYINDTEPGKTKVTYLDAAGNITTGTPVYVQLEREFELDKEIVDVHASSLKPVKDDNNLPTSITVPAAYQNYYTFDVADTKWSGTTPVAEGETYTMTVKVTPKDGYALPTGTDAKSHFFWDENSATAATWTGNADQATVTFTFSLGGSAPQPKAPVVNINTPVKGQALDTSPVSPNGSVTPTGTTWYEGSSPSGTTATTAAAGQTYTAKIYIAANSPDGDRTYAENDTITLNKQDVRVHADEDGRLWITGTWSVPADPVTPPPQPGGTVTVTEELPVVTYWISDHGFTNDLTAEKMSRSGAKPTFTPKVSGKEGYTFKGWSEVDPATLKQGEEIKLVDPLTFSISEDKTFYAVYDEPRFKHDHYGSGYPDGTFKPEQYITRAEVAAIVANACLDGFDNNENYGNPGNYSDINPKKWYGNDIAYCTMYGVFSGYKDGTFKPDQYITRQELAVVVANMAGMQTNIGMPFTDASSINKWARDGVYTVYKNNWVSGYPDGTFRPQNNITRAETVAIFNGYLHRGVDADGLAELTPYVLNAAAGGYEGDGSSLYMTWTDVPEKYWAYYHIIEAANDHDYHWADEETKLPPEHWDAAYIDQEWRYREEFPVTYVVGDHGTAPASAVLNLSVKSGGRPRTQPHIDPNTDWLFLGWSLTPAGDIVEPLTVTITGATTFYAVYAPQATTYTVRYDAGANGAVSGASSESVIEGQRPAHVPAVNAHEGYTFLGWAETPNGTVVSPADVTIAANKTFYAVYRADQPQAQLQSHTAYMSGYDDGTFRPSQAITRAEVVAMVVRALGTDYDPNHVYDTSSVTDVAGHSAENMIGYCIEKGIFSGYKDGTFLPEGTMTRQEFAVVIANLAGGAQENQGLPFTDANSVNKWARNAVYTVYVNGWIGGYKDGTFQPKNNITRAEAAVIFNGFLGRTVDKTSLVDVPQGATSPWSDVKATNWAYQNIMEATSDHFFYLEEDVEHWAEP